MVTNRLASTIEGGVWKGVLWECENESEELWYIIDMMIRCSKTEDERSTERSDKGNCERREE